MLIDYSNFTKHLIDNFIKNTDKLKKYLESSYSNFDFKAFVEFLFLKEPESFNCYIEALKQNYILYNCGNIKGNDLNTFEKLLDELPTSNLIKVLFLSETTIKSLEKYLKINQLKTLITIPYFTKALLDSLNPYLSDYSAIVFYRNDTANIELFLNSFDENNSVSLNRFYLTETLNHLIDAYNISATNNNSLSIEIKNNILTISYGCLKSSAMLIPKKDFNKIFTTFSQPWGKEQINILKGFLNKEIPYDFVISYFNSISSYINPITNEPHKDVLTTFDVIKNNPYFAYIANEYSILFSVFIYNIYPGDLNEFFKSESNLSDVTYDNYSIFSFLTWLYNKKNTLL